MMLVNNKRQLRTLNTWTIIARKMTSASWDSSLSIAAMSLAAGVAFEQRDAGASNVPILPHLVTPHNAGLVVHLT